MPAAGVYLVPAVTYLQPAGGDGPLRAVDRLNVRGGDEPETATLIAAEGACVVVHVGHGIATLRP